MRLRHEGSETPGFAYVSVFQILLNGIMVIVTGGRRRRSEEDKWSFHGQMSFKHLAKGNEYALLMIAFP